MPQPPDLTLDRIYQNHAERLTSTLTDICAGIRGDQSGHYYDLSDEEILVNLLDLALNKPDRSVVIALTNDEIWMGTSGTPDDRLDIASFVISTTLSELPANHQLLFFSLMADKINKRLNDAGILFTVACRLGNLPLPQPEAD